jgi:hypothetical protein
MSRVQLDWKLGNLVAFNNFKMATIFQNGCHIVPKNIMTFYKGKKGGDAGFWATCVLASQHNYY